MEAMDEGRRCPACGHELVDGLEEVVAMVRVEPEAAGDVQALVAEAGDPPVGAVRRFHLACAQVGADWEMVG